MALREWRRCALPATLVLGACRETVAPSPVASVTVSPATDTLVLPRTVQLSAAARDQAGQLLSQVAVTWSSSNPTVAGVSASGLVTTAALGVDTVVAEAAGKKGTAVLTVTPKQIVVTPRLPSLFVTDTIQLMATVTDANDVPIDAAPVRWESLDSRFATVSSAGIVTGVGVGRAVVSATAATGHDSVVVVVLSPSVRPNREIAFLTDSAQLGLSQLHTIRPDGSGETRVSGSGEYVTEFDWSQGGSRLAVVYFGNGAQGHPGLYVMNADGANPLKIADAEFNPRWSPDGATIAFRNEISFGRSDIYVISATGFGLRRLTSQPGDDILPVWSPDGRRIAYMHSTGGPWELWVMDADGSHQERVNMPTAALRPRWSPDGRLIAFDNGTGVWVVKADGSGVRPLTANCLPTGTCSGAASYTDPAWSNDAGRLAYSAYDQTSQHRFVVVSSLAGTELARVDVGPGGVLTSTLPDWSPDGSEVAYSGTQATPPPWPGVLIMNADGTGSHFVTGPQNASTGRWRP